MAAGDDETLKRPMQDAAEAAPTSARLRLVFPRDLSATVPLSDQEVVLGRRPGNGFRVDDPTVSRRHFAVRKRGEGHFGIDLGSRNGSRVDGVTSEPTAEERPLLDQSLLRIGDVIFVYERGPRLEPVDESVSREAIFGEAAAMGAMRAEVALAAPDPSPVLLMGQTGTGKEYIAREIHRLSRRRGPLVAVNCAALSPQLVESQLFGHAKGAFTGALVAHEGLFRAADQGTIFLDEVGDLPRELQPKLLRVLQEGEVHPVGETRPTKVDVRVISATLHDLTEMIDEGGFRLDLYARLSPWEIRVPSLAERRSDILAWLERLHAAWQAARGDAGQAVALRFEAGAVERILLHEWRDNLRGLDRMIHRACAERSGIVDVPPPRGDEDSRPSAPAKSAKPTREELIVVLDAHGGSVRATAKHFARDRRQIYRWLDQYGLRAQKD